MEIIFRKSSRSDIKTVIIRIGGVSHGQYLNKKECDDLVFNLLDTAIGEIDQDTHLRFIEAVENEVQRAGYSIISNNDLSDMEQLRQEKEQYIKQLEAQISRDRESLIKEGEFVKKYLGDQREWINV